MSVPFDHDRVKFVVRWWGDGKARCQRFDLESDAIASCTANTVPPAT
jgi:hypothetical protein